MNILLPTSLDQWRSPIASLLRAVVRANPEQRFESFSNPVGDEDRENGREFWALPQVRKIRPWQAALTRYDLVQTAALNPRNLMIARYAKVIGAGRTKFLTTINLEQDPSLGERDWGCYQKALRLADHFLAVSEAAAVRPKTDAPDRFLGVIPNGFDAAFFDPSLDIAWPDGVPETDKPFVLWVSALEPRKHPEFLIALAQRMPDVRFVAAGWEHPFHAERFLPDLRAVSNLRWLGHIEQRQLRSLLHHAAVLVFPSEREGLPLTVIESHGMGLPVVAQPKSSLPEVVVDGFNGRLLPLDDIDGWEAAVREQLVGPAADRAAIRMRAVETYAWERVGEAYRGVYDRIAR